MVITTLVAVSVMVISSCDTSPEALPKASPTPKPPPVPSKLKFSEGGVYAEFLEDGRYMRLLRDFSFTDSEGYTWTAKASDRFDGASIPRPFWGVWGGPFEGKFRDAAVIHDSACAHPLRHKPRGYKEAHRAFYEGMLERGFDPKQAQLMYAAVFASGRCRSDPQGNKQEPGVALSEAFVRQVEALVGYERDITPKELAVKLESLEERFQKLRDRFSRGGRINRNAGVSK
jgi:hypothetical protein